MLEQASKHFVSNTLQHLLLRFQLGLVGERHGVGIWFTKSISIH